VADLAALVLLCGIGEDEEVWADVAALLADEAACAILLPQGDSIGAMADDVLARAPARFAIAGHSMGGYVALAVQHAAPDRVTRLALLNSSPDPEDEAARGARERLIESIEADGYAAVVRRLARALVHPDMRDDAPRTARIEAMLQRAGRDRFVREQRAAMARPNGRPALAAARVPMLAIGSYGDRIVAPMHSEEIAATASDAVLVMLDRSGHLSPLDEPQAVAAAMRRWLAG
jgi:pimeloyl-ACP methyl ester carboxylesterase